MANWRWSPDTFQNVDIGTYTNLKLYNCFTPPIHNYSIRSIMLFYRPESFFFSWSWIDTLSFAGHRSCNTSYTNSNGGRWYTCIPSNPRYTALLPFGLLLLRYISTFVSVPLNLAGIMFLTQGGVMLPWLLGRRNVHWEHHECISFPGLIVFSLSVRKVDAFWVLASSNLPVTPKEATLSAGV